LFPPAALKGLYPFPMGCDVAAPWFAQVDIDRPDIERFPKLRLVLDHRQNVLLEPGDTLSFRPTGGTRYPRGVRTTGAP
jgi:hypothetical protein